MKTTLCFLATVVIAVPAVAADKRASALKIGKKYIVVTNDGKVHSGVLTKQDKKSITLKRGKTTTKIPRDTIESIRPGPPARATAATEARRKLEEARRRLAIQRQRLLDRNSVNTSKGAADKLDPTDPKVRLLILSPKGPLLADVSIYVNNTPFRMLREAIVNEVIKQSDTNKDGKRTWTELFKNPRQPISRLRAYAANGRYTQMYIKRYDLNGDTFVDRQEVRRMISQLGFGSAFNITSGYTYYSKPNVKDLLDVNKDGKLSKDEIAAAASRLKSRDANDNDLVEASELGGGRAVRQRGARLPTQGRGAYAIDEGTSMASLYYVIQRKYQNEAKQVPKSAFAVAPKLFDRLDMNKNGLLDSGEMIGLHLAQPQLKVEIRIGKDTGGKPILRITPDAKDKSFRIVINDSGKRTASLGFPGWKLRLNVPDVSPYNYDYTRTAQSYITRYDADKNGYIDNKDVKQLGTTGAFVTRQITQWDQDGDGKVFAKEIKKYYDNMQAPQRTRIAMSSIAQGPSLFAVLDISGDNRLSLREMRTAAKQLQAIDTNKNGIIDADEMPGETVLSFTQGTAGSRRTGYGGRTANRTVRTPAGPKWFVHMDKNADGDITLREFLGTKQQFAKLDKNKDGFIEPKEAEAAGK